MKAQTLRIQPFRDKYSNEEIRARLCKLKIKNDTEQKSIFVNKEDFPEWDEVPTEEWTDADSIRNTLAFNPSVESKMYENINKVAPFSFDFFKRVPLTNIDIQRICRAVDRKAAQIVKNCNKNITSKITNPKNNPLL